MSRKEMFIFCVALFFMCSCNDEGVIVLDDYIVKDTTQYTLEQTEWNLVLFVDAENNTSRKPIFPSWYKGDVMYVLVFNEPTEPVDNMSNEDFWAFAEANRFFGHFVIDYTNSTIQLYKIWTTAVGIIDENDEENYKYGIRNSTEFEITATQLKLFYNDRKNYLLFNRRK